MNVHTAIPVQAPAAAAWELLGPQFGAIGEWACDITASRVDGPIDVGVTRICVFDGGEVGERLIEYDPDRMVLRYEGTIGMPRMMKAASNRWSVVADGPDRCVVHSHATIDLVWWARPFGWLIKLGWGPVMKRISEDIVHRIEEGVPHPSKLARGGPALTSA